jgi:S1-C subfamily serine protease
MLGINIGGVRDDGKSDGVEVLAVSPGGPADKSGLKAGDVLLSISGKSLAGSSSQDSSKMLLKEMEEIKPGDKVTVEYIRNGKTSKAEIETVAIQPPMFGFAMGDGEFNIAMPGPGAVMHRGPAQFFTALAHQWGDMELADLTPALGKYFGTEDGVLVVRAPGNDTLQLEDGDVILSIDGRKPNDPNHALRILRSYASGESLSIEIMRDKRRQKLAVTVPEGADTGPEIHFMPRPMSAPVPAPAPRVQPLPPNPAMADPKARVGV